jgi:hypothetical protein
VACRHSAHGDDPQAKAKWSNQGVSPQTEASDPAGSPWKPLYKIPGEPFSSPAPQQ